MQPEPDADVVADIFPSRSLCALGAAGLGRRIQAGFQEANKRNGGPRKGSGHVEPTRLVFSKRMLWGRTQPSPARERHGPGREENQVAAGVGKEVARAVQKKGREILVVHALVGGLWVVWHDSLYWAAREVARLLHMDGKG